MLQDWESINIASWALPCRACACESESLSEHAVREERVKEEVKQGAKGARNPVSRRERREGVFGRGGDSQCCTHHLTTLCHTDVKPLCPITCRSI